MPCPRRCCHHPPVAGATIPELLTAVTVAAVLFAGALPAYDRLVATQRATVAVNGIIGAVQLTRASAMTDRRTVTLCALGGPGEPRACGGRGDWHHGARVFDDANGNRRWDDGERLYGTLPALPDGSRLDWRAFRNRAVLRFRPSGLTDWQNGHFLYCPPGGDARFARQVILNAQGRARLARDVDGDGIAEDARGRPLRCPS